MRNKHRRIVCLILVIITLLTGICLENIGTGSDFVYSSGSETGSVLLQRVNILKTSDHYATKRILLQRTNHIQKNGHYITKKVETKLLSHLLCSEHFSLFWENLMKSSEEMTGYGQSSKELVTSYIQKSDGKKRI